MSWRRLIRAQRIRKYEDDTQIVPKFRVFPISVTTVLMKALAWGVITLELYSIQRHYQISNNVKEDYSVLKHHQQTYQHLILSHIDTMNKDKDFEEASLF